MADVKRKVDEHLKHILEQIAREECREQWQHEGFWVDRDDKKNFLKLELHRELTCTNKSYVPAHSECHKNKTNAVYETPTSSEGSIMSKLTGGIMGKGRFANASGHVEAEGSIKKEKEENVQWKKHRVVLPPHTSLKYADGTLNSEYECRLTARADSYVRVYSTKPAKVGASVGTGVGAVGGAVGGAGGVAGGIAIGAALGIVVPGVGNAVGGIIGGIGGAIVGAAAGGGAGAGIGAGIGTAVSRMDMNTFIITAKQLFDKIRNKFNHDKGNNRVSCTVNVSVPSSFENSALRYEINDLTRKF